MPKIGWKVTEKMKQLLIGLVCLLTMKSSYATLYHCEVLDARDVSDSGLLVKKHPPWLVQSKFTVDSELGTILGRWISNPNPKETVTQTFDRGGGSNYVRILTIMALSPARIGYLEIRDLIQMDYKKKSAIPFTGHWDGVTVSGLCAIPR